MIKAKMRHRAKVLLLAMTATTLLSCPLYSDRLGEGDPALLYFGYRWLELWKPSVNLDLAELTGQINRNRCGNALVCDSVRLYPVCKIHLNHVIGDYFLTYARTNLRIESPICGPAILRESSTPYNYEFLDSCQLGCNFSPHGIVSDQDSIHFIIESRFSEMTQLRLGALAQFTLFNSLDSSEVIPAVIEILSLFDWNLPTFVIRDAEELFELSNTLVDDAIWNGFVTSDTVRTAIRQLITRDVSAVDVLIDNYTTINFEWSQFQALENQIVKPSRWQVEDRGWSFAITTWCPKDGVLAKWTGEITQDGTLSIHPEILAIYVGPVMRQW